MAKSTGCRANQISASMSTQDQLSPAFDRRIFTSTIQIPLQTNMHLLKSLSLCLQAARIDTDIQSSPQFKNSYISSSNTLETSFPSVFEYILQLNENNCHRFVDCRIVTRTYRFTQHGFFPTQNIRQFYANRPPNYPQN